jgi:leader peptidase (prepilin peptidase) / N-methyltransferase
MLTVAFPALVAALFGLTIGSFLNVVVARVPGRESLLAASHCRSCRRPIGPAENIPVLSWLLLRGRCRGCRAPIGVRYPLVEAGTAVAFGAITAWIAHPDQPSGVARWLLAAALCLFAAASIALALIDLETHRLPDAVVGPAYALAAVSLCATSAASGEWADLSRGLAGMVLLGASYYVVHAVRPDGMGFGDVKLAGLIGLVTGYVGWGALAVGALAAFVLAACFGVALVAAGRAGRRSGLAFGPWMLAGGWLGLAVGTPVAAGYLHVSGLA